MTASAPPRSSVTAYAHAVVTGGVVAGRLVRLACERHLRDLETGPARGLRFDTEAADRAIMFFGFLKHSKGEWAGQPLQLEPWQCFIVGSLFGWLRADGTRRFRTAYEELARKNGKSTIAAGIGLLLAFFDGEGGAEVYAAATKRDQAKIVWGEGSRMVKASPSLRSRITVLTSNMHILSTNSKFEPLGADNDSTDGLNIHGAVVDELHAHKTRSMVDVLETATGARRQPLVYYITTAGYDRHSVCWEKHDYGIKVLEGIIDDDTYFAFIATIDEGDDWTDPTTWPKANPNLGISVKLDDLVMKCERAKQVPGQQNAFKRLHLDVWTEQAERWLSIEVWNESAGDVDAHELRKQLKGGRCFGGLDLSSKLDLSSFSLFFPPTDEHPAAVLSFSWIPEDNMRERVERDRVPYDQWVDAKFIAATEGNVIDYDYIRSDVGDLAEEFEIVEVGYDPWNATQLAIQLQDDGMTMVPVRQGFQTLSEPSKELEKLVLEKKWRHGGNPVLRWAASNVAVKTDPAGNIKPDKSKSTERIDPVSSLVNALERACRHDGDDGPSIYETERLSSL